MGALAASQVQDFYPQSISLIVKLTNKCNFACKYCGISGPLATDRNTQYLSHERIATLFKKLALGKPSHMNFIWHGGEPLLLGVGFFQKLINTQKSILSDRVVQNDIETNGSLITDEWARFFKQNKFGVGVSIDGPEKIQNSQRMALAGNSYEQAINGIESLARHKVPFATLSVVTRETIDYGARKLFFFLAEKGVKTFDFIPQEPVYDLKGKQLTEDVYLEKGYVDFLIELFDTWYEFDDPTIHIPLFEDIIRTILNKQSRICQIGEGHCASTVFTLYPDGTIQPCDKFPREYGDSVRIFGKIDELDSIDDLFSANNLKISLESEICTLKMCEGCNWYRNCRGGCVFDRYMYTVLNTNVTYEDCSTHAIYEHVWNSIKENKIIV